MMNEPLIADRDFMEEGCVREYGIVIGASDGGALVESTTFP